jgi:stearoyl-CoA desaturase (delta-9 desaturase)
MGRRGHAAFALATGSPPVASVVALLMSPDGRTLRAPEDPATTDTRIVLADAAAPVSRELTGRTNGVTRAVNLVAVILPLLGFVLAIVLLWNHGVTWLDLVILAVLYAVTITGVTVGNHRLLTHRAFKARAWVRDSLAICASMACQGSVVRWATDHRRHHRFADRDGDPHSPHTTHGDGPLGVLGGLWHAHMGWFFTTYGVADPERYAPDLWSDARLRRIDRTLWVWVTLGLVIPFVVGLVATGTLSGGVIACVWGGLVRIFLLHHVTYSVNSICHYFGRRRFRTHDQSRNVAWLALLSFGESWHNNHHSFPNSAYIGLRRSEIDLGGLVIRLLERLGLAWDVRRPTSERQAARSLSTGAREYPSRAAAANSPLRDA